jgi:hypothetical protein
MRGLCTDVIMDKAYIITQVAMNHSLNYLNSLTYQSNPNQVPRKILISGFFPILKFQKSHPNAENDHIYFYTPSIVEYAAFSSKSSQD